jgi:small-conductance mechanosensitive channel
VNLNASLFLGIRLSTVLVCAAILIAAGLVHIVTHTWLKRIARRADERNEAGTPIGLRGWLSRGARRVLPAIGLVVWTQAAYMSLRMLLGDVNSAALALRGRTVIDWTHGVVTLVAACWLLARAGRVIEIWLESIAARSEAAWDNVVLPIAGRAVRRLLPLLALILAAPVLAVSPTLQVIFRNSMSLVLIAVVAFILGQVVEAAASVVLAKHRIDVADNLHARGIYTQVTVLRRAAHVVIAVFALASMLMVFESVRQFGASILASAGVAGIVVGLAAQRSIGALLAGFQIALTQPIRVDDVVIVEQEWGRVEEITLTYVVVRIWDLRRLVVPITYFLEKPFQNWTRTSANLLATVYLHADYTVPVAELRAELSRILDRSPRWDRKVNVLQVTDSKERTIELRALASAADAGTAWDLRCEVREGLVDFLQKNHPDCLPRLRATFEPEPAAS